MGNWMPESRSLANRVFWGEFFWSPAYTYTCSPYHYAYEEWTRGRDNNIPKEVLVTTERYLWERGNYDCSIEDSVHIYLPCKWLVEHMELQWDAIEGHFVAQGNVVAFDPSVRTPGPGALLINRDVLLKFLNDSGYDILWTLLGKKSILSLGARKGRLEISGAYRINDKGKVVGVINPQFI